MEVRVQRPRSRSGELNSAFGVLSYIDAQAELSRSLFLLRLTKQITSMANPVRYAKDPSHLSVSLTSTNTKPPRMDTKCDKGGVYECVCLVASGHTSTEPRGRQLLCYCTSTAVAANAGESESATEQTGYPVLARSEEAGRPWSLSLGSLQVEFN